MRSGGTLHVVAPKAEAGSMTPLTSAFVSEVFIAARAVARTQPGERLDPTLRFVLDEIPNLCPLRHLDEYIGDGRGRGLPVIWFAQTPSQLNDVFGTHKAQAIISASEVMIYGGGSGIPTTSTGAYPP